MGAPDHIALSFILDVQSRFFFELDLVRFYFYFFGFFLRLLSFVERAIAWREEVERWI